MSINSEEVHRYEDKRIASLMSVVQVWSEGLRPIHYPLKNMTRFQSSNELSIYIPEARSILSRMRWSLCEILLKAISDLETIGEVAAARLVEFDELVARSAKEVIAWRSGIPSTIETPNILKSLMSNCRGVISRRS